MSENIRQRLVDIIQNPDGGQIGKNAAADRVLKNFVIIPRSDLPEVKRSPGDRNSYRTDGESVVFTSLDNAKMWCLRDIAVWQFIANEETALQIRRDELAREIAGEAEKDPDCKVNYAGMVATARIAIDRIIALEEAAL